MPISPLIAKIANAGKIATQQQGPPDVQRPLPQFATEWTPAGDPYFGGGIKGFGRRMASIVFDNQAYQQGMTPEQISSIQKRGEEWRNIKLGPGTVGDAIGGVTDKSLGVDVFDASVETLSTMVQDPTRIFSLAGRHMKATFLIGLELLQQPARMVKRGIAAQEGMEDIANSYTVLPKGPLQFMAETLDETKVNVPEGEKGEGFLQGMLDLAKLGTGMVSALNIPRYGWNVLRISAGKHLSGSETALLALSGPLSAFPTGEDYFVPEGSTPEEAARYKANMKASNMVYTAMMDEMVSQEAASRVMSGENPDFVLEDLTNPWAELVGEVLFDPLNIFDIFVSPGKGITKMRGAADEFLKIADDGLEAALKSADNVDDIAKAAENTQKIQEAVIRTLEAAKAKAAALGTSHNLLDTVVSGRRWQVLRRTGSVLQSIIVEFSKNPDEAMELIGAMVRAGSKNPEEVATAISILSHSKVRKILFSDAGFQTMSVLQHMASNADGVFDSAKLLDRLAKHSGNLEDLARFLVGTSDDAGLLAKSIDNLIPDLADLEKAAKLRDAGNTTKSVLKLAEKYDGISNNVKRLTRVYEYMQNKAFFGIGFKGFNRFFAGIYMNLNPGYAMRNMFQNTIHLGVDMGWKTGLRGFKTAIGTIIGDAGLFSPGKLMKRNMDDVFQYLGYTPEGMSAGLSIGASVEGAKTGQLFSKASSVMEEAASTAIYRDTVVEVMENAMRNGVFPSTSKLVNAGLPVDVADTLVRYIIESKGSVSKGVSKFRKALNAGTVDLWRSRPIDDNLKAFLQKSGTNVWDEFLRIRNESKSKREFLEGMSDMLSDIYRQAAKSAEDLPRVGTLDDEIAQAATVDILDAAEEAAGAISSEQVDKFNAMVNAMADSRSALQKKTDQIVHMLNQKFGSNPAIVKLFKPHLKALTESNDMGAIATKQSSTFRKTVRDLVEQSRSGKNLDELADLIPDFGRITFNKTYKTGEEFRSALWNYYFDAVSTHWLDMNIRHVDIHVGSVTEMLRTVGYKQGEIKQLLNAEEWLNHIKSADELFNARTVSDWTLPGMKNRDLVRKIFSEFGLPSQLLDETSGAARHVVGDPMEEMLASRKVLADQLENPKLSKAMAKDIRAQLSKLDEVIGPSQKHIGETDPFARLDALLGDAAKQTEKIKGGDLPGADLDDRLIDTLNKWLKPTDEEIAWQNSMFEQGMDIEYFIPYEKVDLAEGGRITVADVVDALYRRATAKGEPVPAGLRRWADEAIAAFRPSPSSFKHMPSDARALYENLAGFVRDLSKHNDDFVAHWGETGGGFTNPQIEDALAEFEKIAEERMAHARIKSSAIAQARRDFALHSYKDKTYADLALAMIYPYQYWYTRTYMNWMPRLMANPVLIAEYAKYRTFLEREHAGMDDWWKYNLSTNDLPGIDSANPIFFNLESSLNPLQGLIGVDFNDPKKRVNWYSRMMDDLAKFGPTVFTPYNWLIAAALYSEGEQDAGRRWMGRLMPQSQPLKYALYKLGIKTPMKYNEFDPFVQIFGSGLDPYEEKRVGRALGAWVAEGATEEERRLRDAQAQEAARSKSGPLWEEAVARASSSRATGQLLSFFGGTGFKARTQTDMQIDNFYTDYYSLMSMRPNLSPLEFRNNMTSLRTQYPWMDTLLISRKPDDERDTAYAYSVLTRVPPGQLTDLAEASGINSEMVDNFYNQKGTFEGWTQQDIDRFMGGIVDLGALLAIPDDATSYEWNIARDTYSQVEQMVAEAVGQPFVYDGNKVISKGIFDQIDYYWTLAPEERTVYETQNPLVAQALEMQTEAIINNPIAYKYYGGIDTLNRYYIGKMYADLDKALGADIHFKIDEYKNLQVQDAQTGGRAARAYYRAHPEIKKYYAMKAAAVDEINRHISDLARYMPDEPQVQIRSDFAPVGQNQEKLLMQAQQKPQITWPQWQTVLSEPMQELLIEYFAGQELPSVAKSQLEFIMEDYGFYNVNDMIQAIGQVIPR